VQELKHVIKPTFMEMKFIFLNGRLGNEAGGHR
jgi:hypothetical protein